MTPYRTLRAGVILAAKNVAGLSTFYREALGFELAAEFAEPPYVILHKSGMRLSLTTDGVSSDDFPDFTFRSLTASSEGSACLVLEVDNCNNARAALAARGVRMRSEVFRPQWGGARFFCEDPERNLIEIEELA